MIGKGETKKVQVPSKEKSTLKKNISIEKSKSREHERPRSVKVFTKKPLNSGLFQTTEISTSRADYTNYPLASPDVYEKPNNEITSDKKRVTFLIPQNNDQSVHEFK